MASSTSSCLGGRKQVQDTRFDSHLTGVKKESFYWRMKTIAHNKGFRESKLYFFLFSGRLLQ